MMVRIILLAFTSQGNKLNLLHFLDENEGGAADQQDQVLIVFRDEDDAAVKKAKLEEAERKRCIFCVFIDFNTFGQLT